MQHDVAATLINGVFVPEQPVSLPEGSRVQLTIADVQRPRSDQGVAAADDLADSPLAQEVLATTKRIFGDQVGIKWSSDAEYPSERNAVFVVHTTEAGEAVREKERQWIRETREAAAAWPSFSLLIRVD